MQTAPVEWLQRGHFAFRPACPGGRTPFGSLINPLVQARTVYSNVFPTPLQRRADIKVFKLNEPLLVDRTAFAFWIHHMAGRRVGELLGRIGQFDLTADVSLFVPEAFNQPCMFAREGYGNSTIKLTIF